MTKEEAIKLAKTGWWKNKTDQEIVAFQLYERFMCMDFSRYHQAVEKVLDRPVYIHEFCEPETLRMEFEKKIPKATMKNAIDQLHRLAKGKPVLIVNPVEKGR